MKKNSVLVKKVLMSTLTAVMFASTFTACSDEIEGEAQATAAPETVQANAQGCPIGAPLGLDYKDFITPNDVEILNADTTEIAVSKALADKKGITSFVGHPMSVWSASDEIPYLRRTVEEKLEGDRYVLKVQRAGVAEFLAGQCVEMNTAIYVNPNAGTTRGGSPSDKYTDEQGRLHPVAVCISALPDEEGNAKTRSDGGSNYGILTAEQILGGENFNQAQTRGFFSDTYNALVKFVESGGHLQVDTKGKIINLKDIITPKPVKISIGKGKNDTININSKIPYDIALDYTLKVDAQITPKTDLRDLAWAALTISPSQMFNVDTKLFQTRLDGSFKIEPEMTVGIGAKAEIPKDKQNLKIANLGTYTFFFQAGPATIPVAVNPNLYLHLDAKVEAKVYTGVSYKYQSKFFVDLNYKNGKGWGFDADWETVKNEPGLILPRGSIKGKAGAGVMLGVDVAVGGVAGPTFSVGPMVTADMNLKIAPFDKDPFAFDLAFKCGIHGRAGAKLKLWSLDIADWQTDIVFGPEKTLWEYHCDSKALNSTSMGGYLFDLIEDLRKDTQKDANKVTAERTATPEDRNVFEQFKSQMERDYEVQNYWMSMTPGSTRKAKYIMRVLDKTDQLYSDCLYETFCYGVATYGHINSAHFDDMKNYLLERMIVARSKANN